MLTPMQKYFDEIENYFVDKETEKIEKCIICDSPLYEHYDNNEKYASCKCGFVWNYNQPTNKVLDEFYSKSDAMTQWSKIKSSVKEIKRQYNKFSPVYKYLTVNHCKNVLDYGCGNGVFLNDYKHGDIKVGIEVNEDAKRYCNFKSYNTLKEMIDKGEEKPFDAVTAFGVLEHYKDPINMIQSLAACLTDDGSLIFIVPNVDSLVVKYLKTKCATFCPQHLWYFNQSTLDKIVKKAIGFYPVETWTVEHEAQTIARYVSGLNPYENLKGYNLKDPRFEPEMIISFGLGYKICAIYKKG